MVPEGDASNGACTVMVKPSKQFFLRVFQGPSFASCESNAQWDLKVELGAKVVAKLLVFEDFFHFLKGSSAEADAALDLIRVVKVRGDGGSKVAEVVTERDKLAFANIKICR